MVGLARLRHIYGSKVPYYQRAFQKPHCSHSSVPVIMDSTLTNLIDALHSTLNILKGDAHAQLQAALHDHDKLPNRKLADLAAQAVDLLHETEQLLEPGSLVLADHFLGTPQTPSVVYQS